MPSTGHQSHAQVLTPELKRGDQLPDLVIALSSELGPVDVSDAFRVRVLGQRDGRWVIDRDAAGDSTGQVTMPWELSDVAVGGIGFEVEVTWTGSSVAPDPDHPGLYEVPDGWTEDANGLYPIPQGWTEGANGLYSTSAGGAPRRRTFPSQGLVWVWVYADVDGTDNSLVEDPPGSGLYLPGPLVEDPPGSGLYDTGPLVENPIGSGLYGLQFTGG